MTVSNERAKATELVREIKQAVLTRLSLRWLRYLGHNIGECDASFGLCCLQLNSFKVPETVL